MVTLLLACTSPDPIDEAETEWVQDLVVETSAEVPSVITVSFTTPEEATAWVEFGAGGIDEHTTPESAGTAHTHHLVGLAPLTAAQAQVVVEVDGEHHRSGLIEQETGQILPETPIPEVTVSGYSPGEDAALLISLFGSPSFVVMMGLDGTVFWSRQIGEADVRNGLGCLMSVSEGLILFNSFDFVGWGGGLIHSVGLDGVQQSQTDTPGAHHFFEQLPDGSLVWMAIDPGSHNGEDVVGDKVVRRYPDGTEATIFSTWDHLTVYETDTWSRPLYDEGYDWSHGNGLTYDAARDTLLVSTGGTNVIAEITTDGELLRLMGGQGAMDGDYSFNPPNSAFAYPHGPHYTAAGELMLMSTVNDRSRLVAYEVDDEAKALRETWSFGEDLGNVVQVLGEVEELPDGNRLVSWGSLGRIQVITPKGEILWEAETSFGSLIGQVHLLESPYGSP